MTILLAIACIENNDKGEERERERHRVGGGGRGGLPFRGLGTDHVISGPMIGLEISFKNNYEENSLGLKTYIKVYFVMTKWVRVNFSHFSIFDAIYRCF